jgi:hypothetical protein
MKERKPPPPPRNVSAGQTDDRARHLELCRLITRTAAQRASKLGLPVTVYLAGVLDGNYPKLNINPPPPSAPEALGE